MHFSADKKKASRTKNSAPPDRHLSSQPTLIRYPHLLRARVLGFVLLPLGCAADMPAPRHVASHPTTIPRILRSLILKYRLFSIEQLAIRVAGITTECVGCSQKPADNMTAAFPARLVEPTSRSGEHTSASKLTLPMWQRPGAG